MIKKYSKSLIASISLAFLRYILPNTKRQKTTIETDQKLVAKKLVSKKLAKDVKLALTMSIDALFLGTKPTNPAILYGIHDANERSISGSFFKLPYRKGVSGIDRPIKETKLVLNIVFFLKDLVRQ